MKRLIWALAAALMLTTAAAAPASASDGGASYQWLNCPAGTVTGQIDSGSVMDGRMVTQGVLHPCRKPAVNEAYALAVYMSNGNRQGQATAFGGWEHLYPGFETWVGMPPGVQAICLIIGPTTRLDCRSVTTTVVNGTSIYELGSHIPVDSPIVNVYVQVSLQTVYVNPPGPTCPSCWG